MKIKTLAIAALLVLASTAPAAVAATTAETRAETYSGDHVSFETTDNAVVDYQVDGTTVVEDVKVESASSANADARGGLVGVVSLAGAGISLDTRVNTQATLTTDSGAQLEAHDNENGVLVVASGDSAQVVHANVSAASEAEAESDNRVVVRNDDGTEGTFIVVGDGKVTVDQEGNVAAQIEEDSRLVYRQYDEGRDETARTTERLIANGTATAEVYYQQTSESGGDGTQRGADVVQYSSDTTVEVTSKTESELNMTVERTESEGKVVVAHLSEAAMENAGNTQVYVDGEAAAEASSYSEVVAATEGESQSAYMVRQSSSAEAATEVVVGVNHFSARDVSMQSGEDGTSGSDGTDDPTGAFGPGFGVVAAIAALGAALIAARQL